MKKFVLEKKPVKKSVFVMAVLFLVAALVLSILLAVSIGSVKIPFAKVYGVISENVGEIVSSALKGKTATLNSGTVNDVVWYIRLPRLVLSLGVGMGLSVCGVIMQAVVKNPLAEPYVLGISSGASLGATSAIMLGVGVAFGANSVGVMACIGAFLVSLGVVGIANIGGRANSVKLLLAGMALSSVCGAFSSFIVYFAHDKEGMETVTYWTMGSMAGASWERDAVVLPIVFAGTLFFCTQYRTLNLMLLGDEAAITLGTDLHRWRQIYLLVSALMVGFVVYAAGMIGFVGLVIPHVVRMIFGTDHRKMIPISALVGAIFLIWADVLCRVLIRGMELPIGILTSMIGGPCFIYLMARKRYGFGGGD